MSEISTQQSDPVAVLEEARPELKKPELYQVILLNDDFTPMDFVVEVLSQFFGLGREQATQIMFQIHSHGKGICGVFPYDVAETKVALVTDYARAHEYPLLCDLEVIV